MHWTPAAEQVPAAEIRPQPIFVRMLGPLYHKQTLRCNKVFVFCTGFKLGVSRQNKTDFVSTILCRQLSGPEQGSVIGHCQ